MSKKKGLNEQFSKSKEYFTRVDIRQTTSIPIQGKKPKIVTYHPPSSYELQKESDHLTYINIKNPEEFWSASKYLIVEVKQ